MNTLFCAASGSAYDLTLNILYIVALCFIPAVLWALYVSIKVKIVFNRYNQVNSKKGIPAYMVARQILDSEGLTDVQIGRCSGSLSDHYDPRSKTVVLSDSVYNSSAIAAIGVAAHEVGHAIQHAKNYAPVKIRGALVPVLNLSSKLLIPVLILNILLSVFLPVSSNVPTAIYYVLLAVFGLNLLFALVTLPVEFNASNRAKDILDDMAILDDNEIRGVSRVLRTAAMTYVASFVITLIQFARILLIVMASRKKD